MDEIVSRIIKWMEGEKAPPSVLSFNMIDGCNQRCKFCDWVFFPLLEVQNSLIDEDYYRFIKQAAELDVDEVRICGGGEPLFNKHLTLNMISLIKKYGMKCHLITNGTLFTDNDIKKLIKLGIDFIEFSIHGPDAATHDYLVSLPGAFDRAINNVKRFNYWKKKLKKDKPELNFWLVLTKLNYNELDKMILLASELNINHLEISELFMRSKECKKLEINESQKNELYKNIRELKKIAENHHISFEIHETIFHKGDEQKNKVFSILKIDKSKHDLLNVPCYDSWYYLTINGDGKVDICPEIVGNYLKIRVNNKTLKDIWYGNEMKKIRERVLKKEISGKCQDCCNFKASKEIRENLKNLVKNCLE